MNYKIVCDSSCDVLDCGADNFSTVPMKIIAGERQFIDDKDLDVEEMLDFLAGYKEKSGSSCPNVTEWLNSFDDCENIFCVAMTSSLSGSFNSARLAVNQYLEAHPDRHATVIDTLSTGPENALIFEKIKSLADSGLEFDEVCQQVKEYQKKTHLLFALESMHNLAVNGRVSPVKAKLAGLLGIRAIGIASEEGTLEMVSKQRGLANTVSDIFNQMKKVGFAGGRVKIHHAYNEVGATDLEKLILTEYPGCQVDKRTTTALCSFYAERGGILVGFEVE